MAPDEIEQIRAAMAALEAQRALLGDAVVETALAPLREKLTALTRAAPAAEERKRVTVLFSDLAGFTALSETMDPEDVHAIIDAYFARMTAAIVHYGGTVEKYIGDAVMALFGAPRALENHEEMAVRAALAMHQALAEYNEELERERDIRLAMRVGINTGLVLFGAMGGRTDADFAAVGDAINLASRLQSAAPVNGTLVSAETARRLHAIFDFEPPQQITVKGKREPITVYVVGGEKTQRGRVRGIAGLYAPMVGRDAELATLQTAFERALAERCWQIVLLVGEAGVGKSRLQREFVAWLAESQPQARLLSSRCYAHTATAPYYPIAELMRGLFNLGSDASPADVVRQLHEALPALDPAADEAEFRYRLGSLAGVLGFSLPDDPLQGLDPEQRRDRTFLSLERLFLAASAAAPLVIVVDDLHWADALSFSFVERLVQTIGHGGICDRSALVLLISRPAEESDSALARIMEQMARPPCQVLTLTPLDTTQSNALIAKLVGEAALPPALVSLILERTQGNPFFVEEMLRSLIENGTLVHDPEADRWRTTQTVAQIEVPDSVQGVLAARLDRLPTDDKYVLQRAAIIGRTFWQRLLSEVSAGSGGFKGATVEMVLARLEERQLILRLGESQIADDWEWIFRHVLAQEVAYASVTREVRRRIHAQVARRLESYAGEQTASLIPLIAYHYERGAVPDRALEYLRRAGEQAAAQFANESAVDYFGRALAALEQVDRSPAWVREQRYALLLGRESVYGLMGQREAQAADLAGLKTLADEMGDDRRRAEVARRHAVYYEAISDFPAALAAAQEAVRRAEQAGDPCQKVEGLIDWGIALWRQGIFEDARRRLEEALALARQCGHRSGEAAALHNLGTVSILQGDCQNARDHLEKALEIRRGLGDRQGEATSLSNLVAVYNSLGDLAVAKECGEQALAIHQSIGNRRGEVQTLGNQANILHALGDLNVARAYHERALALSRTIGDRGGEALAAENLGLVLHHLGDDQAARRYCEQALEIERAIGNPEGEGYCLTYLALALEGLGELDAAAAAYTEALRLRREIGQAAAAVDDLAGLARVALGRGQIAQAADCAQEALDWIAANGTDGIEYPLLVYSSVADALAAAGQEGRAIEILGVAHGLLQEQAARISDEAARRSFLENVPLHRRLCERFSRSA